MKRLLDIIFSIFIIMVLSPIFLVAALIVAIDDGFPVVFKQERVGKDNKLFYVRKFRTMKNGTRNVATSDLVEAPSQITRSGWWLRRTSIDELPQLLNILEGTMSFVGPRPLIPSEKEIRELRIKNAIYSVRPGITGWAQINGRDNLSIEKKTELDKEYIDKQSLLFDIKILFKTVFVVLKKENVIEGGEDLQNSDSKD